MGELSRLKLRCRRGMKELDVVLGHYLDYHYPQASIEEKQQLETLLDMQDPLLWSMILGLEPVPECYSVLIARLRQRHV